LTLSHVSFDESSVRRRGWNSESFADSESTAFRDWSVWAKCEDTRCSLLVSTLSILRGDLDFNSRVSASSRLVSDRRVIR